MERHDTILREEELEEFADLEKIKAELV